MTALSPLLVPLVFPMTTRLASVTYLLLVVSAMSIVVASAPTVTSPFASYVILVLVALTMAAFSSTLLSNAVCKSVCVDKVPVILPQVAPAITTFPLPSNEVLLTVLILVPEIRVSCFKFRLVIVANSPTAQSYTAFTLGYFVLDAWSVVTDTLLFAIFSAVYPNEFSLELS